MKRLKAISDIGQQQLPLIGQQKRPIEPPEEWHAKIGFKPLYLMADGCWRYV